MSSLGEKLLEVIDQRIDLYLKRSNFVCEYPAIVKEIYDNGYVKVQLPAQEAEYRVPVRNGVEDLYIGCSVMLKCRVGDFTNAIVIDKFIKG